MKIVLLAKQRRFLLTALRLYDENKILVLPRQRINNILKNGYYFDDKTSYETPPKDLKGNHQMVSSDTIKLNRLGELVRRYYNEQIIR